MSETIPTPIKSFASEIQSPVAVIGCRTSEISLDCCEYDLAIYEQSIEDKSTNRVMKIGNYAVEVMHFSGSIKNHIIDLANMIILKDNNKLALSSAAKDIVAEKYQKMLAAYGKKSLVSSLLCQQKMLTTKHPVVAAMWLKIAAYDFIDGIIALSGNRPMPLHILEQIRQIDSKRTEGIEVALECIGAERATRPSIARSMEAIKELKSKDYDRELFVSKVCHLLERRMLVDCYYYAGGIAAKNLVNRPETFYRKYFKLVQLALDLISDLQSLQRMQKRLDRAAKIGLGC
ncbi:MAG: hypothetical protein M3270_05170 [Thermoproteota archaeon]|nr:hypothetical protein [Thermoproteota archaeon]